MIRIPRTTGLTALARSYQADPTTKRLKQLHTHLLSRYIHDGFRLNGELVDITTLATYTGLTLAQIVKAITKSTNQLTDLASEQGAQDTQKALLAILINGALADRGRVLQQERTLSLAQGAKYVPFLTGALNQAQRTMLESNKPLIEILKALNPSGTSINITNQNQQANIEGKALGPNEAVKLIDAKAASSLLEDTSLQQGLIHEYIDDKDLPEIIATKQQGVDDGSQILVGATNLKAKEVKLIKNEDVAGS